MWLNNKQVTINVIKAYRERMLSTCPNHIVIDNLFAQAKIDEVIQVLHSEHFWKTQKHIYSSLYVDNEQWQQTNDDERFVKRDIWQYEAKNKRKAITKPAREFLLYLRSEEFMSVLSCIFNAELTDINVANPAINTNYFRLNENDFVKQHADDTPGRIVCMLLYLNKDWEIDNGGELVFLGTNNQPVKIAPLCNRCVLFDPSSEGAEHWVQSISGKNSSQYRYNVTSWYWTE